MLDPQSTTPSWESNLRALWFAELFAVLGFGIFKPVLPLYVSELGGGSEQWVRIWAGIVVSAPGLTMIVFGPLWGTLTDRIGSKVMVLRAALSAAILTFLMALARSAHQLALIRLIMGIFSGTVSAAATLVALSAPQDRQGRAFGVLHTVVFVGSALGPLLGGLVADYLGYTSVFWVAGATLSVASLAVIVLVKEPNESAKKLTLHRFSPSSIPSLFGRMVTHYREALASRELRRVLWAGFVMRLGANLSVAILPLFIQAIAATGARVGFLTGAVTGLSSLAGAVGSMGTGRAYERLGGRRLFVIATLVSAVGYVLHLFVRTPVWILPLQVVTGLALGSLITITRTWLSAVAVAGQEGTAYGLESSSMSFAFALAPLIGSVLAAQFSLRLSLVGAAVLFVVAAITVGLVPDPAAGGAGDCRSCCDGRGWREL